MSRARGPMSPERLRALLEERFPAWGDAQLADRARMGRDALVKARRGMGFVRTSERHEIPPETYAEIARRISEPGARFAVIASEMGIARSWVDRVRKAERAPREAPVDVRGPFTADEVATLRELVGQGFGASKIAKLMGRSVRAIEHRMLRIDAPPPKWRSCLCCRARFLSEGPHNRMCDRCRSDPDSYDPLSAGWTRMRARVERSAADAHARRALPANSSLSSSPGAAPAVSGAFSRGR